MKTLRTYAKHILFIEFALAVVLAVGLLVPLPGRVEFKIVQSGSMEPSVPVGALLAIVPQPEYEVGDIITFGDDTRIRIPTTHRIVGVERVGGATHYRTKGDANEEADNTPVPYHAVIGAVVITVPRLGYVLDFVRTQKGYLTMVVIPATLIILDELLTIAQALRKRDRAQKSVRTPVGSLTTGFLERNNSRRHESPLKTIVAHKTAASNSLHRIYLSPHRSFDGISARPV